MINVEHIAQRLKSLDKQLATYYAKLHFHEERLPKAETIKQEFAIQAEIQEAKFRIRSLEEEYSRLLVEVREFASVPDEISTELVSKIEEAFDLAIRQTNIPSEIQDEIKKIQIKFSNPQATSSEKLTTALPVLPSLASYESDQNINGLSVQLWAKIKVLIADNLKTTQASTHIPLSRPSSNRAPLRLKIITSLGLVLILVVFFTTRLFKSGQVQEQIREQVTSPDSITLTPNMQSPLQFESLWMYQPPPYIYVGTDNDGSASTRGISLHWPVRMVNASADPVVLNSMYLTFKCLNNFDNSKIFTAAMEKTNILAMGPQGESIPLATTLRAAEGGTVIGSIAAFWKFSTETELLEFSKRNTKEENFKRKGVQLGHFPIVIQPYGEVFLLFLVHMDVQLKNTTEKLSVRTESQNKATLSRTITSILPVFFGAVDYQEYKRPVRFVFVFQEGVAEVETEIIIPFVGTRFYVPNEADLQHIPKKRWIDPD